MRFNGAGISGARRNNQAGRGQRGRPVLWVSARQDWKNRGRARQFWMFILVLLLIGAMGFACWVGLRMVLRWLFIENSRFNIVKLEIEVADNAVITPALVREYTQVKEGMNLFEVDISAIREDFMLRAPNVKSMEISRRVPETLKIKIDERVAIGRVGRYGEMGIDREGVVFGLKAGSRALPRIIGHSGGDNGFRPGNRLCGWEYAAVQVLSVCDDPRFGVYIENINVSNSDYLVLNLTGGKTVKMAWEDMGEPTMRSRSRLQKKLGRLSRVLQSDEGKRKSRFDCTFEGRVYAED